MRRTLLLLVFCIAAIGAWASKAITSPFEKKQSDGTILTYHLHGDEDFHYVTTTDGILIVQDGSNFCIASVNNNGELISTGVIAHNAGTRNDEEQTAIKAQDKSKFFDKAESNRKKATIRREPIGYSQFYFPHSGSPKALIVLADFKDQKFKHDDQTTMEIFDQYLNADGQPAHEADNTLAYNHGSVKDYFKDMSFGNFTPIFDVKAVVHLKDSMKVYGAGHSDKMSLLIPEVCDSLHAAGVDFSDYDYNSDGYVDIVYIIYAGYGASMGADDETTIWPKCGYNTVAYRTYNNKKICRYGVHNELILTETHTTRYLNGNPHINGIGLFCHEFSHAMGLPDFYPVHNEDPVPAMEYWDVMDGGEYTGGLKITNPDNPQQYQIVNIGYCPTAYTAWEREAMGWLTIRTLTDDDKGTITLQNIDQGGKAYRIYPDDMTSGNDYIILQNIQAYGWNQALANTFGHGLLITHVDYDATAFTNSMVNDYINHPRMTLFAADSIVISSNDGSYTSTQYRESHKGDPYPGSCNVTEIPYFTMYYNKMITKPFYNIKEEDQIITFDFIEKSTDGIINITDNGKSVNHHSDKVYTIDGRYIGNTTAGLRPGIYIRDGKKVVVK